MTEKGYEIVIPLENIRDVAIKSLGGVYIVTLYDEIQMGKELYFKASLLYPLDHKKQEAKVDLLWGYVEKAKMKSVEVGKNRLKS